LIMCKGDGQWIWFIGFVFIWSIYQSVINKLVFTILTSVLTPSISCAYQSGKVSLSPMVIKWHLDHKILNRLLPLQLRIFRAIVIIPVLRCHKYWRC
jgi:hypothetical protein